MKNYQCVFRVLTLAILVGCSVKEPQLFELVSPEKSGITFSNTLTVNDSINILDFDYMYNGGGVAVGDINNDGLPDLYFTGNMVSSRLYLNKGNLQFEDITEKAGVGTDRWTTGVSMVDINQDGHLDIYVCVAGKTSPERMANLLFINQGNNTFVEQATQYGLADTGYSTQAAFFDYDRDGDLDVYMLTNGLEKFNRNVSRPKQVSGEGLSTDRLYRNNGDGTFTDVSREAGITVEGYGLGVAIADINRDGWPDVYAANDFITNDLLWMNNGDGTFSNQANTYLKHTSYNGMGTDVADFNNDGLVDIVELDMLPEDNKRQKTMLPSINHDKFDLNLSLGYQPQYVRNTLQLNNGNGTFSEIGQLAGVHNTDWSWSALFADYDNDGFKDLLITNGYRKDVTDMDYIKYTHSIAYFGTAEEKRKQLLKEMDNLQDAKVHNYIFKNNGDMRFINMSQEWGFSSPTFSNGAAYADLDNDGDLDLIINNIDEPASIYKNNAQQLYSSNFLKIKLAGRSPNRNGLGAKIELRSQSGLQFYEHNIYRGYKSTVDPSIHFGLGTDSLIQTLTITWPDGKYQHISNVRANQLLTLDYTNAQDTKPVDASPKQSLFREVTAEVGVDFRHKESEFMDFKVQPLLPHKLSRSGPGIAVGDINRDGMEDFYVGGAANHSGMIYLQRTDGKFDARPISPADKPEEDMGSLFFDADGDGDLDLYVVSGSTEFRKEAEHLLQDRLYLNDGKANFTLAKDALPEMFSSGSCVTASDFDQDGDLDVFVGGRVIPGQYPLPARSYILRNDKGHFTDVTNQVAQDLAEIGLVTSALWTDFDNDGQMDLIVMGEWMPITFYKNTGGKFTNVTDNTGLSHTSGWWNSIAAGDFDQDGDMDYVLGNLGLNSKYKASPQEPVRIHAKDYDRNGNVDPVLSYYIQGKNYAAHPRDVLIDQIISMRRRFPQYLDYALATFDQTITPQELEDAYVVEATTFETSYLENTGNGKFRIRPLPVQAQFAPTFGILCQDFDGDGHLDIVLAGNSFSTESLAGWYDASIGLYLRGDGKGEFAPVQVNESGFFVNADTKGMAQLMRPDGKPMIAVACNNDKLQVFAATAKTAQHFISLQPTDVWAEITLSSGKVQKQEFYYGSAYLSQSSRTLLLPDNTTSILVYDYQGRKRNPGNNLVRK